MIERILNGIVLGWRDRGETDTEVFMYTREMGKVWVLAKGIKHMKAKLRSDLLPYTLGTFEVVFGRSYIHIVAAETLKRYISQPMPSVLTSAAFLAAVINSYVGEKEKDEALFELLEESFSQLLKTPAEAGASLECLRLSFLLRFLVLFGASPLLCVSCGDTFNTDLPSVFSSAGFLCASCAGNNQNPSAKHVFLFLRQLSDKAHCESVNHQNLRIGSLSFLLHFLRHHSGIPQPKESGFFL